MNQRTDSPQGSGNLTVGDAVSQLLGEGPAQSDSPAVPRAGEAGGANPVTPEAELRDEVEEQPLEASEAEDVSDQDDDDTDDEPDEAPPRYAVKADGEDVEVTLEQLVESYQRTSTVTRKQQEMAEERKRLDQELATTRSQREQYAQQLTEAAEYLERSRPSAPAVELLDSDPREFMRQKELLETHEKQQAVIHQQRLEAQQKAFEDSQMQLQEHLQVEGEKVREAIPEWRDNDVREQEQAAIRDTLVKNYGYEPEVLNGVNDSRLVQVARDAWRYQMLVKEGRAKLKAQPPKVIKSSDTQSPRLPKKHRQDRSVREANAELDKTGSIEAGVALLLAEKGQKPRGL